MSLLTIELDRLFSLYLARSWLDIMYSTRPTPGRMKSIITHAMVADGRFLSTNMISSAASMLNMYKTVMNFIVQPFSKGQRPTLAIRITTLSTAFKAGESIFPVSPKYIMQMSISMP